METEPTTTNTDKIVIAALLCLIIGVWIGNQITTYEVQQSYQRGELCPQNNQTITTIANHYNNQINWTNINNFLNNKTNTQQE